jgi:flagellar biosynthesis protein FlhG
MADQDSSCGDDEEQNATKAAEKTRIIAISSGKGGVGRRTSLSTWPSPRSAGKEGDRLDADLGLANVNVILGVIPNTICTYHPQAEDAQEIILDTPYGIQIVAGASGFSKIANLTDDERESSYPNFRAFLADIIIMTERGRFKTRLDFIAAADDAIIVTPRAYGDTDAYGIIKIIATEIDNMNLGLKLVVNRVRSVTEGKAGIRAGHQHRRTVHEPESRLPRIRTRIRRFSRAFQEKPFIVSDPNSKAPSASSTGGPAREDRI